MLNEVEEYVDCWGRSYYSEWLDSLKDKRVIAKVIARVERMIVNNFGDSKLIGDRIYELRIHHGPGFRVYYAQENWRTYLLLCGGDKKSQSKDIALARALWATHRGKLQ